MEEKLNNLIETENDGLHCCEVQFLHRENFESCAIASSFRSPVKIKKILRDVRFNTIHCKIDFTREQGKKVSCYHWKRQ